MTPPSTIVPPTLLSSGLEYSIHECPARNEADVGLVFPQLSSLTGMLIVPTTQRAIVDLVGIGANIEQEKDALLEKFMTFARAVHAALAAQGFWSDYIDPCSGLPMVNKTGVQPYDEVQALATLRGYATQNAGCCKVVLHPTWGSAVYPATLFAKAPVDVVEAALAAGDAAAKQAV